MFSTQVYTFALGAIILLSAKASFGNKSPMPVIQDIRHLNLSESAIQAMSKLPDLEMGISPLGQSMPIPRNINIPFLDYYLKGLVCRNNFDGNYPNPFNCNRFTMCSGGNFFEIPCSSDCSYLPFADLCSYSKYSECPLWISVWSRPQVTCSTHGQRPWWSTLVLPTDVNENCGRGYVLCLKYFTVDIRVCPRGAGYSKAMMACVPLPMCELVDRMFGLWR